MRRKKITLKKFLIYVLIFFIFTWKDLHYFITGWNSLGLENGRYYNIAVSQDSGSLIADDKFFLDHSFYYFPEGVSDPSNFKTDILKGRKFWSPVCFFDHEERIYSPGKGKRIFHLNSGEYEDLPEIYASRERYDCTTLDNGDLLISAEQGLIFYRPAGWELIEIPELDQHFQVTIDKEGIVWIGTADGRLFTYNMALESLTLITDISSNPIVAALPLDGGESLSKQIIRDLQYLPNGMILIQHGSRNLFVWELVGEEESLIQLEIDPIYYVVDQDTGVILVSTEYTIFAFDPEDYSHKSFFPAFIAPDSINALALDTTRNILYISGFDDVYYRNIRD